MADTLAGARKVAWIYGPALAVLLVDQLSKQLIRERVAIAQEFPLLPGLSLTHVTNQGGAFSLFYGQVALLASVSVAIALGLILYERTRKALPRNQAIGLGILLGGTVGNLVDRLVFGHVTDFLDVYVGAWHWPTFNIADVAINGGAAILALSLAAAPQHPGPDQEEIPR